MKSDFLLEIGCENLPSGYIDNALKQLEASFSSGLAAERISFESLYVSGTPNRLVVEVRGLAGKQEETVKTVTGPPVSVAIGTDGKYTKAAEGFARREGVSTKELTTVSTEKGEYLAVERRAGGKTTRAVLTEMLPAWITGIRFPKVMKWDESELRFARPVRWILCLFGGKVLRFMTGNLASSSRTRLSPYFREFHTIKDMEEYHSVLKKNGIELDHSRRREIVAASAEKAALDAGGKLVRDEELCSMVANLIESPVVMTGEFDKSFLKLPREVIVTALKSHQRYFSVEGRGGRLKPIFVAFADGATRNKKEIVKGYERVLQARLSDAEFYFREDTSRPLEEMASKLDGIVWLEGLGDLGLKASRISRLSDFLLRESGEMTEELGKHLSRAARLAKADLASEMVKDGKEFTLLQGYIGREYSRVSGEPEEVSEAIYEHYFPRFAGDRLPIGIVGTILSVADKLDTITGCYIQGFGPTGSQDPYALRRSAMSILRIAIDNSFSFCLDDAVSFIIGLYEEEGLIRKEIDKGDLLESVSELFSQRFNTILRSEGYDHDLVSAVLSAPWKSAFQVRDMTDSLQRMRTEKRLADFVLAMKRISNIIPKSRKGRISFREAHEALTMIAGTSEKKLEFDTGLFLEEAEKSFYKSSRETVNQLLSSESHVNAKEVLDILFSLVPSINAYFDEVLINCEDEKIRENRLSFLSVLRKAFGLYCDYSLISGE